MTDFNEKRIIAESKGTNRIIRSKASAGGEYYESDISD